MAEPVLDPNLQEGPDGTQMPGTPGGMPLNPELTTPQQQLNLQLKLKAQARMRQAMEASGYTPEEWTQKQREKWRWSAGTTRGMLQSAQDLAADYNTGFFGLLGPTVQDALAEIGTTRPVGSDPYMGIPGKGAEVVGQGMGIAMGAMRSMMSGGVRAGLALNATKDGVGGTAAKTIQEMLRTAGSNPAMFMGSEVAGGMAAGMSEQAVLNSGSPNGAGIAALGGGLAGGAIPVVGLNFTRQAANWALLHLAPWTEKSGTLYAARRLQSLAENPDAAAANVKKGRKGVSPARRTQDQNLLALEARVLEDNPQMNMQFTEALDRARTIARQELRNEVGELRVPGEWERSVLQKAAAPGTVIEGEDTYKMLEQAYDSFRPLYTEFTGYPVKPHLESNEGNIPFQHLFAASIQDPSILAAKNERTVAQKFLENEISRLNKGSLEIGATVDSGDLLVIRQNIRDRIRTLMSTPDRAANITARLLSNAEAGLTSALEQQLPGGALETLQQIDNQYRVYSVVEQAVFASGGRPLDPRVLSKAVRDSMPPSQSEDLQKVARAGRNVESVIGKPREAREMVRGQDPKTTAAIQSDFLGALWQRSLVNEVDDDGHRLLSGKRLLSALASEKETASALGIDKERYGRMMGIAREMQAMDMKSPKELDKLLTDGPSNIMQLLATMVGVHSAKHFKPDGPGALVLAGFFARTARNRLAGLFGDEAQRVLIAAHRDPELYAALLVKPTSPVKEQDKAARVLNAWLYGAGEAAVEDAQE